MPPFSYLPFAAAAVSLLLALASLLPKKRSPATWCFCAGMALLGVDSLFTGLTLQATQPWDAVRGLTLGFIVKSFLPAAWLGFSLTYSRGDYRGSVGRWILVATLALLPVALSLGFQEQLIEVVPAGPEDATLQLRFGAAANILNVILLVALVGVLMNLEQTFRSAVGATRWQVKFVVLGLAVIFAAHVYVRSQALIFSAYDMDWSTVKSSALLIGCVFLGVAYLRTRFAEVDLYPSRAVLRSSLTVLIAGGYLLIVGVLAKILKRFGRADSLEFDAFLVLVAMSGLAVLLLSDRLRQRIHDFVSRHFVRAQHDSVRIWTGFSKGLTQVRDEAGLCSVSAKLVSETFEVLSVTVWLLDEQKAQFTAVASTAPGGAAGGAPAAAFHFIAAGLSVRTSPFDLDRVDEPWAEQVRQLSPSMFPLGGKRWCVPLRAGDQCLGALVLADRVNGAGYTFEQRQMLQCIADQMTSVLLNLRLASEVASARELEAFRTMSAFFVHDLKNAAASLNLMLKNLPEHFDNPAFRADALRSIGNTARRIDEMITRLSALRRRQDLRPVEADLNELVSEALEKLDGMPVVELTKDLQPLPRMLADREQIRNVVTNMVLNARDAVGPEGRIRVRTEHLDGSVVLSVTDNGCGISPEFLKDSLFRPFQSTKKKGLGIGMFQCRMIVEAHGGNIRVESETGKGSTFRVTFPVKK